MRWHEQLYIHMNYLSRSRRLVLSNPPRGELVKLSMVLIITENHQNLHCALEKFVGAASI